MAYTIKELTDIDAEEFYKLTKHELNERLIKMDSIIQRRIAAYGTFNKGKGISQSPALRNYLRKGGEHLAYTEKIYTKNELRNVRRAEIRAEYIRGMRYLQAESSTASGWYKLQTKTLKSLKTITNIKIKHKDFDRFWSTYDKLIEQYPELALPENKYEAFRQAAKILASQDALSHAGEDGAGFIDALVDQMTALYESAQSSRVDELSGMFKLRKKGSAEDKKKKSRKGKKHSVGAILDVDSGDIDVDIDVDDIL